MSMYKHLSAIDPNYSIPGSSTSSKVARAAGQAAGGIFSGLLGSSSVGRAATDGVTKGLEGTPEFDNMKELLDLQRKVQLEIQRFTTLTNLAKTEHDGRMSAVRNMRS